MHLLPLLLIPVVLYIVMTANNPPTDPKVRVQQQASSELLRVRQELADVADVQLSGQQVVYVKGGRPRALTGVPGQLEFSMDGNVLVIKVTAREGGHEKIVMARLPV